MYVCVIHFFHVLLNPQQTAILESGSTNSHLEAKVFRCLGSWFSVYAVPESVIINSKLLSSPFDALVSDICLIAYNRFIDWNNGGKTIQFL